MCFRWPGRASFSYSSKPAQLQLEQIRLDDEGEYRCRVDFRRGRTVNTIISLRVVVPPQDLRIVAPGRPAQKLEGLIGPYNEGSELVLVCLASGGKPRPQVDWRRDYNVIDETYQHLDKDGKSQVSLLIRFDSITAPTSAALQTLTQSTQSAHNLSTHKHSNIYIYIYYDTITTMTTYKAPVMS